MLESVEESKEVDWDCCLYIWPDGSYWSYNLEQDEEEDLGKDGLEVLRQFEEKIHHLQIRVPVEGHDYGHIEQGCE
jgi:hypothetical protein